MNRSDEERWAYRISAVAKKLDISKAKAYELVREGKIRVVKIGAMLRVPADELLKLVRASNPSSSSDTTPQS